MTPADWAFIGLIVYFLYYGYTEYNRGRQEAEHMHWLAEESRKRSAEWEAKQAAAKAVTKAKPSPKPAAKPAPAIWTPLSYEHLK